MDNFKKESLKGFFWLSVGKVGAGLSSFIVTVVLVRLLIPEDFALVELLMIIIAVSSVFIDSGFSQAIIRDPKPSQVDLSSVFLFNLCIACALYVLLFITAVYIAVFFNAPQLVNLSRVTFLVIIFNSLVIIQDATLTRQLNFKVISQANIIGMFGAGLVAIILGLLNMGVWAITANIVLQPLFKAIMLWSNSKWRPSFVMSIRSVKKYFSFSSYLMMQGLLDAIMTNLSSIFIGRVYTKADLGYYSQGRKLDSYVISPFITVLEKVTYPITAKIDNESDKFREVYINLIQLLFFVFTPLSFYACCFGKTIVTLLFGDNWIEAGVYFSIISLSDLFFPLQRMSTNIIMIKGETKRMFYLAFVKQLLRLIGLLLLYKISMLSLVIGFSITGIVGGLLYTRLAFKLIHYRWVDLFKDQLKTFMAASIGLSIAIVMDNLNDLSEVTSFFMCTVIMLIVYLSVSVLCKNKSLYLLINMFSVKKYRKI